MKLEKVLGPGMLWGLGVGYVISGMYFGWNLGLIEGGSLGLAIATLFVALMYTTFSLSYAELTCAIPKAGGVFDYALTAFGPFCGSIAGIAQIIEFVFAPPAIAFAIGSYFHIFLPQVSVLAIAIVSYILFTGLNILGVKAAARFELFITIFAVLELLLFSALTLPSFQFENLAKNSLPNGITGIFAALPFAIWFFLGIEGLANVAEETKNPQKDLARGFFYSIVTLVVLCVLTFFSSVGVQGWEYIVYAGGSTSDSPLPLALKFVVGEESPFYHLLITVGLFGLVASFHGLILASGRASFEFGKAGFAPAILGQIHPQFKTPAWALFINMIFGILALLTGKTGEIITIACFGALLVYIMSMLALFKLRKSHPNLQRPFKVPLYPAFPLIALIIATISMGAMTFFNLKLAVIFGVILMVNALVYQLRFLQRPMKV